jgi:hypothetical protein
MKAIIEPGSLIGIPLVTGDLSIIQAVGLATSRAVRCIAFNMRATSLDMVDPAQLAEPTLIGRAIVLDTRLRNGRWTVGSVVPILVRNRYWPFEECATNGWVGASFSDPALFEAFVNSWFGLRYWNDWYDPNFLNEYLINPAIRPPLAIYK